jgi:hypothetical protein
VQNELWELSTEKLSAEDIKELQLAEDNVKETAFHFAARRGKTEVLQKLLDWSTDELSAEEIIELLLAEDNWKQTAFHCAAESGETVMLQKIW